MTALDVNFVRAQFPAFAEPSLDVRHFSKMLAAPIPVVR